MPTAVSTSATRWPWSPGTREPDQRFTHDVAGGEPRVERAERVLEHDLGVVPEPAQRRRSPRAHLPAVELDAPRCRRVEAEQDAHQRRLARARLADDAHRRAGFDREVDTAQRLALGARSPQRRAGELVHAADRRSRRADAVTAGHRPASAGSAVRSAAASSSTVYGSPGRSTIVATGPASTMRPWRITIRSSATNGTRAMSWVMNSSVVPSAAISSASSASTSACTVTSSAVVGSSAISNAGRQARAMAMPMRCR